MRGRSAWRCSAHDLGPPRKPVARPVELLDAARRVADDDERLTALAPLDDAEPVGRLLREHRRPRPGRRAAQGRLEPPAAPAEHELEALRPPAAEHLLDLR